MFNNTIEFLKRNKYSALIIIAILAILLVIFIPFWKIYWGANLSSDSSDWGNFGDYISGTLGVIIAIINLLLMGYIAIKANELTLITTFKMNEKNLKVNNYNEFSRKCILAIEDIINSELNFEKLYSKLNNYRNEIITFQETHMYLWIVNSNSERKQWEDIQRKQQQLQETLLLIVNQIDEINNTKLVPENFFEEIQSLNRELLSNLQDLIKG